MGRFAQEGVNAGKVAVMRKMLGCKNDAALSRALEVAPPVISKINHGRLTVGDTMLITLHELTGMGTKQIKAELGLS